MRTPVAARGFTLVEVLVALAILEVGLAAAAGSLLLAARIQADAVARERAAADAAALVDSLLAVGGPDSGWYQAAGYRLSWARDGAGWRIVAVAGADTLLDVAVPWAP